MPNPCAQAIVRDATDPKKLDVWSLACVLLEMMMGRGWFEGDNSWLQAYRHNR